MKCPICKNEVVQKEYYWECSKCGFNEIKYEDYKHDALTFYGEQLWKK